MSNWIKCSDKFPSEQGQVLARYIKPMCGVPMSAYETMYFEDGKGWLYWHNDKPVGYPVTHWTPITDFDCDE